MFMCVFAGHALLATDNPTAQLSQSRFHSQCGCSLRVCLHVFFSVCVHLPFPVALRLPQRQSVSIFLDTSPVSEATI